MLGRARSTLMWCSNRPQTIEKPHVHSDTSSFNIKIAHQRQNGFWWSCLWNGPPLHSILNRDSPVYLQYDYALITRGWGWFDHRFRWALCILCAGVWTAVAWWNGKQAYAYPYIEPFYLWRLGRWAMVLSNAQGLEYCDDDMLGLLCCLRQFACWFEN